MQCPLPQPMGDPPAGRQPQASPLGQVWQQCPGSSVARGQAGTGQSCFMFLQFTFPAGFPRRFLCCGKSPGEPCQCVPPRPAWIPHPSPSGAPAGSADTLHSLQLPERQPNPGPLPTAPSPLPSCARPRQPRPRRAARREGEGRRPSPRRWRRNEA